MLCRYVGCKSNTHGTRAWTRGPW